MRLWVDTFISLLFALIFKNKIVNYLCYSTYLKKTKNKSSSLWKLQWFSFDSKKENNIFISIQVANNKLFVASLNVNGQKCIKLVDYNMLWICKWVHATTMKSSNDFQSIVKLDSNNLHNSPVVLLYCLQNLCSQGVIKIKQYQWSACLLRDREIVCMVGWNPQFFCLTAMHPFQFSNQLNCISTIM